VNDRWRTTILTSESAALAALDELKVRRWLFRGHPKRWDGLVPPIDRPPRHKLNRTQKLMLERRSIETFRANARFFAGEAERSAMKLDPVALMVLRHYGVPTRLLDWSMSPFVAAYFAAASDSREDGEIWCFDEPFYQERAQEQWKRWPETTAGRSGDAEMFRAEITMFAADEPPAWFSCGFYPAGFPRQHAQAGAYSMTARFSHDHADAIADLLEDDARFQHFVVSADIKRALRKTLRQRDGIWRGALFPDSAGAATTANEVFEPPAP
jgi:hypothetical protein